jgi:hypothetical protein
LGDTVAFAINQLASSIAQTDIQHLTANLASSHAELDPAFTDSKVLVAYAANGKPLPDGQGPFRIVAPQEKRPARWIRMLQPIQVVKIQ